MNPYRSALAAVTAMALLVPLAARAEITDRADDIREDDYKLTVSSGYNYSSGDYGSTADTHITYIPLTVKVKRNRLTHKLTIPYIRITGPGVVTGGNDANNGAAGAVTTEEGLGDIVFGTMYTTPISDFKTYMDVGADLKLPTADEGKKLGTGAVDITPYVALLQQYGKASFNAKLGRKINGNSDTSQLNDVWRYSVGAGYKATSDLSVGASYNFRENATDGSDNFKEATAYAAYKLTKEVTAQLYAGTGFSDASPDFSTGLQFSYKLNVTGD